MWAPCAMARGQSQKQARNVVCVEILSDRDSKPVAHGKRGKRCGAPLGGWTGGAGGGWGGWWVTWEPPRADIRRSAAGAPGGVATEGLTMMGWCDDNGGNKRMGIALDEILDSAIKNIGVCFSESKSVTRQISPPPPTCRPGIYPGGICHLLCNIHEDTPLASEFGPGPPVTLTRA